MPSIILTGLPGTGKTALAMKLASALMAIDQSALILHTDILKIELRKRYPLAFRGPGYSGNVKNKLRLIQPYLQTQCEKAEKENYYLIIEGTLALGFSHKNSISILLELPEDQRNIRLHKKHESAIKVLYGNTLDAYQKEIEYHKQNSIILDSSPSIDDLIHMILPIAASGCNRGRFPGNP
jgi:uridine kinase